MCVLVCAVSCSFFVDCELCVFVFVFGAIETDCEHLCCEGQRKYSQRGALELFAIVQLCHF